MKTTQISPIPAGNPYHHDLFHCGVPVGDNVEIMYTTTGDGKAPYVIVVDKATGERVMVFTSHFSQENANVLSVANFMGAKIDRMVAPAEKFHSDVCDLLTEFFHTDMGDRAFIEKLDEMHRKATMEIYR